MAFKNECNRSCVIDTPWCRRVPRHAPTLIAVHHQFNAVAHVFADCLDDGEVVFKIRTSKADLQRREAKLASLSCNFDHVGNAAVNARRCICADLVTEPTEHAPHGLVLDLADQVPQCQIKRPWPAGMKLDVGQHCCMTLNVQWVFANEVPLVVRKAIHGVARTNSAIASIVEYSNDGGRELCAWPSVPRSRKRWIKRQLMVRDLDSSDRGHVVFPNYARMREPLGSKTGSSCNVAGRSLPMISISKPVVPSAASSVGMYPSASDTPE